MREQRARRERRFRLLPLFTLLVLISCGLISCRSSAELVDEPEPVGFSPWYTIDASLERSLEPDPAIEELLNSWREEFNRVMMEPLTTAEGSFTYSSGRPESSLGNLVTDIVRYRASLEMHTYVDIALLDADHLRADLPEGAVKAGDLYELMPFDHRLVVLEIDGRSVQRFADDIASRGGVPVSGLRMNISGGSASGLLVDSERPDPDGIYYLATSSAVADGYGTYDLTVTERHEFPIQIRDLLMTYLKNRDQFTPVEDLRIRQLDTPVESE